MSDLREQRSKASIVVERVYAATLEEVWELWTTKDGFESWWGPQGFRVEVHEIDARLNGALRYDMIADSEEMIAAMDKMGQPRSHPTTSRFSEFAPQSRLVLTNVIDFLPGVASYESKIAVDFSSLGDTVQMRVTLDAMHSDEFTKMQKDGFTSQLSKLDQRFAKATTSE